MVTLDDVKVLREETGISIMECKKALEEAGGDFDKARALLRKQGAKIAAKKAERKLGSGVVASYIHSDNKLGVLVEVLSETDFVARNDDFRELANDIAMHIAALSPEYVKDADVNPEERARVRAEFAEQDEVKQKPENIREKIIEGKTDAYFKEKVLLRQPFVKNGDITVEERIQQATQKTGEKIEVVRFVRMGLLGR
ncbi:MAG: elongation factor Ts [Parcubacteria group bacterium]|nr:elongation factor Ts [Parcubacteria group bacterium]